MNVLSPLRSRTRQNSLNVIQEYYHNLSNQAVLGSESLSKEKVLDQFLEARY